MKGSNGIQKKYLVAVVEQATWIPIGYPEDIKKAKSILLINKVA
jgi:NDP-sugar pyrophosphorylase family protein